MNKYSCEQCNYETSDKSNYNKHLQSVKHNKKQSTKQAILKQTKVIKTYKNEGLTCSCGKQFSYASGLSRHKRICNGINISEAFEKLTTEIKELKQQINTQHTQQLENPTQVYNIAIIKNYILENYALAPPLTPLSDYSVIEHDHDDFGETLISIYNDGALTKYLSEFIIKYYKKANPEEQSIWNSDTSRLKYLIKSLIDKNKSFWYPDSRGVLTKETIIDPLLKYIRDYCFNYQDELELTRDNFDNYTDNVRDKMGKNHLTILKIMNEIDLGNLANEIIRYIAPYFHIKDVKLIE